MNASDVMKYGHHTVLRAIDGLREKDWHVKGVCGVWSVKDIIAHLSSFEQVLVDILSNHIDGAPTPTLDLFRDPQGTFNDKQVALRKEMSVADVVAELNDARSRVAGLISRMSDDTLRRAGTIPWYGAEYALDDFIVYANYGHKREHCAQIALYRKRPDRYISPMIVRWPPRSTTGEAP